MAITTFNTIRAIFKKELKDLLRDRRTMIAMLLSSIVAGPLVLWGLTMWIDNLESKVSSKKLSIVNIERAPSFKNFLERQDVTIETPGVDYEAQVKSGKLAAVLVIGEDFEESLRKGEAAEVELFFDSTRASSGTLSRSYRNYVREFNNEQLVARLVLRGVSPQMMSSTKVVSRDFADERQRGAFILFGLQISLLIVPLASCLSAATDVTAGERERSSLEPLVMNPVTALSLIIGKWLAVTTIAVLMLSAAMTGYIVALQHLPAALTYLKFGLPEAGAFMLLLLPISAMFSAICMTFALAAKSFKEAQTYLSYLVMVVSFVPTIGFVLEWADKPWQLWLPVTGQNAVMSKVLGGKITPAMDFIVPGAICVLITVAAIAILARFIQKERIIFGR